MEGLAGAGGLKDVVRGLACSLAARDIDVTVYIPRYGFVPPGEPMDSLAVGVNGRETAVDVQRTVVCGLEVRLLDAPEFRSKADIYTYTAEDAPRAEDVGRSHHDVDTMNILFQKGALSAMDREGRIPDVIHGHDGHCGLLPLLARRYAHRPGCFDRTGVLVTIHNAGRAYQQIIGSLAETARLTGLPETDLRFGLDNGSVNPLILAGVYGHINTVSPEYASDLLMDRDQYSGQIGRRFRELDIPLPGIYNGINPDYWNSMPMRPGSIDETPCDRRHRAREAILRTFEADRIHGSLPEPNVPWFLFHGRITHQKGLDSILELPASIGTEPAAHLILYGQGDPAIESRLIESVSQRRNWTYIRDYDPEFTKTVLAASSYVLVPSQWEPCGLIDIVAQLYGALPIVRGTGGLKKVRHRIDGFRYSAESRSGLERMMELALRWERSRPGKLSRMRRRAENTVYERRTWTKVLVRRYLPLYERVWTGHRRGVHGPGGPSHQSSA